MERAEEKFKRACRLSDSRGFTLVEMLIVIVMISIVVAFAVMRIAAAQRTMRLTNSARELMGWLEKARLDSLRRHPMSTSEMASVTVNSLTSYSVVIDQNGDGMLDPPRVINIPATHGARFSGISIPTTIRYNWRGRPLDASGNLFSQRFSLSDAGGNNNLIEVSTGGDTWLDRNINVAPVSINTSINTTSNIQSNKRVP